MPLALASCSDTSGPELLGRAYSLRSVNGVALPHRISEIDPDNFSELIAEVLAFDRSDSVSIRTALLVVTQGEEAIDTLPTRAGYDLSSDNRIVVSHFCDPVSSFCQVPDGRADESGELRGDSLVLTRDWFGRHEVRVFRRAIGN
jgi:hypothetical protein